MQTIEIESVIRNAAPVSPDRKYSLAWSSSGMIGIRELKDNTRIIDFRSAHGEILKAGFSPDMRQLVAQNEDGTFSIWFIQDELDGQRDRFTGDIVKFMYEQFWVPRLDIYPNAPSSHERRYQFSLQSFLDAKYEYYDWPDC